MPMYVLRDLPQPLWNDVRVYAEADGLPLRRLVLELLQGYVDTHRDEEEVAGNTAGRPQPEPATEPATPDPLRGQLRALRDNWRRRAGRLRVSVAHSYDGYLECAEAVGLEAAANDLDALLAEEPR